MENYPSPKLGEGAQRAGEVCQKEQKEQERAERVEKNKTLRQRRTLIFHFPFSIFNFNRRLTVDGRRSTVDGPRSTARFLDIP